jgi:hypothetical protein
LGIEAGAAELLAEHGVPAEEADTMGPAAPPFPLVVAEEGYW